MAFARVNSSATFAGASDTTIASAATSLTTGNLIVVQIRHTGTVSTVTDTAGNTYTLGYRVLGGSSNVFEAWYCLNATGHASNVVTVTFSGANSARGLITLQYSTTANAVFLAAGGRNDTTSSGVTIAPLTVRVVDGLLLGLGNVENVSTTWTAGSGMTTVTSDGNAVQYACDRIISSATTATVAVTNDAVAAKYGIGIAFSAPIDGSGSSGGFTPLARTTQTGIHFS